MEKRLIVNADDYGHTPGVSQGIREAYLNGIVTSTTVMMNMPSAAEDVEKACRMCPGLGLGVHLVMTDGSPINAAGKIGSITAGGEVFLSPKKLLPLLPSLDLTEVRLEWDAQVERFMAITGRAPDHLDAHHHIVYYNPILFRAFVQFAAQYHCPLRIPFVGRGNEFFHDSAELLKANMEILNESAAPYPHHFIETFYNLEDFGGALKEILLELPEGNTELMCHPGYADTIICETSSYNTRRQEELTALTVPGLRDFIKGNRIQLINFSDL